MSVFTFVIVLVIITTLGKIVARSQRVVGSKKGVSQLGPGEIEGLRDSIEELSGRLLLLEEERDFFKDLMESPTRRELPSSGQDADA